MRAPSEEWHIEETDYPAAGADADKLRFLLRYAILAPSGHNTQPWRFQIDRDMLELWADRRRALPVVDPDDRALVISCGAALGILRVAMRRFGHRGKVQLLPSKSEPDLLARVGLGGSHEPTVEDEALFRAIGRRRTTRRALVGPIPEILETQLSEIAAEEGLEIAFVSDPKVKSTIAALVREGDEAQFSDPRFRRELGSWVHSRWSTSRDGMSGANFGMPDLLSAVGGLVIRTFDIGAGVGAKDQEISESSPALVMVATSADDEHDWLLAGMAHVLMLLKITASGLTSAYMNQPIEVDELRPRLKLVAGLTGFPQLLFRIGHGPDMPPAVRRPVDEVLLPAS